VREEFPGVISIHDLVAAVRRIVGRSSKLQADFGSAWEDDDALRRLLERNPIDAWVGAKGTTRKYFDYQDGVFQTLIDVDPKSKDSFAELTLEVVDWRLADYRSRGIQAEPSKVQCKVIQSSGRPIIKLPDGDARDLLPAGLQAVSIDGKSHVAMFAKIAINKIEEAEGQGNVLPQIMRKWFGPDAGQPGTRFTVDVMETDEGWEIVGPKLSEDRPQLWKRYSREQIPGLYGFEFNTGSWNSGFVRKEGHTFLLVTLDKQEAAEAHQYSDYFVDQSTFHWQSQNQTTPSSKAGQSIKNHENLGIAVHLFVRPVKKEANKAAPFFYCGELKFQDWEGGEGRKEPISVTWKLMSELPDPVFQVLKR